MRWSEAEVDSSRVSAGSAWATEKSSYEETYFAETLAFEETNKEGQMPWA